MEVHESFGQDKVMGIRTVVVIVTWLEGAMLIHSYIKLHLLNLERHGTCRRLPPNIPG
jgi:hypothetical protein